MNVWKLTAPDHLSKETVESPEQKEGEIKVRITEVLINTLDALIYNGTIKVTYPLVLGRFAIGRIVSEGGPAGLEKGTRVCLHAFPQEKDTGTEKVDFSADRTQIRGQTVHGYFRDFICLSEEEMTAIPDSVSDSAALLIELVSVAKATIDALDIQKGQHIAVIGGDILGIIICQLLIYQQASPILIDNHTNRLNFAKQCGIYYTSYADDTMMESLAKITGGRLADGAIFVTSSGPQDKSLPFKVSAAGTNTVFCGFHGHDVPVNLDLALKKQISIYGITNGTEYIPTAINLLANKAIELSLFQVNNFDVNALEDEFEAIEKTLSDGDIHTLHIAELI